MADDERERLARLEERGKAVDDRVKSLEQKLWAIVAVVIGFVVNNLMGLVGK